MPIIIPPKNYKGQKFFHKKEDEKARKIIIYFKKELDAFDTDSYIKLANIIKKAQELDLFDEVYMVKGRDVLDLIEFKEEYSMAALNEIKYIKEEIKSIRTVVHGLLKIVRTLREHLLKIYQKI